MTVYELIEELRKYDPDRKVVVNLGINELANGVEVGTVGECHVCRLISIYDRADEYPWVEDWIRPGEPMEGYEYEQDTVIFVNGK